VVWQTARSKRRRIAFMNGPCLGAGAAMALRYTFRTGHSRSLVKEPATHPSSKWYRISQSIYHTDFNIFYQHLRISQTNKIRAPKTKQNPAYWAGCFVPNSCADFFFCGSFFLSAPGCFILMYEVIDSGIQPKSVLVIVCEIRQRAAAVGVYVNRFRLLQ